MKRFGVPAFGVAFLILAFTACKKKVPPFVNETPTPEAIPTEAT